MNYQTPQEPPRNALILSFSKRRGRPKLGRLSTDTGTPELVMKRLIGETMEALNLCLERKIITPSQHWRGHSLRWLYTLRHGAPGVRTMDPTHLGGRELRPDDPLWRIAREAEYHEAIKILVNNGHALTVMNICIYNERPNFPEKSQIGNNVPKEYSLRFSTCDPYEPAKWARLTLRTLEKNAKRFQKLSFYKVFSFFKEIFIPINRRFI